MEENNSAPLPQHEPAENLSQTIENQPFQFPRPETPVSMILGVFVLFSLLGTLVSSGLTLLLGSFYGLDAGQVVASLGPDASGDERNFVRWMLALSHLGTFLIPGVLTVVLFFRGKSPRTGLRLPGLQNWLGYLKAERKPNWTAVGLGILLLVAALPLVHYLYGVNKALPLPDWMHAMEGQTEMAIKSILRMDSPWELLANLIIMALLPAIGEELVFRGILQQQLMRKVANPWVAILLAGAIFSAIHLQFEGFLPRWLLGVLLGWLFWRSQNFWVPVAAHFFNNAFQVAGAFLFQKELTEMDFEQDIAVPWYAALLSVLLVWVVMREFDRRANASA